MTKSIFGATDPQVKWARFSGLLENLNLTEAL